MAREIVEKDISLLEDLLKKVLNKETYKNIERLGGLTNHTYKITLDNDEQYILRIPGDGTEELINRKDEQKSTMLACDLGIDAKCLFFGEDGSKVTEYIKDAVTMSSETIKEPTNIAKVADIFKKLHSSEKDTGVPFEVFEMAAGYEKIIFDSNVKLYEDYDSIKAQVMDIKNEIDTSCDIKKVPCHNDPLCENWVLGENQMYLIDWEYAGMNDGMWDLADVSIEASYTHEEDELLLKEYFSSSIDNGTWKHFLASKIYVDYLWTLWAKTRVPFDGQPMEDWATERYLRLKNNIIEFNKI